VSTRPARRVFGAADQRDASLDRFRVTQVLLMALTVASDEGAEPWVECAVIGLTGA
jgi:hypothetical protein